MPRPQVTHDGFLIPNAADVTNPRMAEPDRIDFNTLAHNLWGVLEGCEVTVAGTSASTLGGLFLVNGVLVTLRPGSVSLGIGGAQDRFDLVVADTTGALSVVVGIQAVDPVFPDPSLSVTVLAAVFCPAGSSSLVDNVIDKRKFVPRNLLTKIGLGDDLVRNVNGTGDNFRIDGSGAMKWMTDTAMWRSAPETLRISKNLNVDELLQANNVNVYGRITAGGSLTGSNLITGTGNPPANANQGTLFQNTTNGRLYVRKGGAWQELATLASASPVGSIMSSIEPPSVMEPLGWVPFNGSTITEEPKYTALFQVQALQRYITAGSPRTMKLPNAAGYVLMGGGPGFANGQVGVLGGVATNQRTLTIAHMPKHGHDPTTVADGEASPKVTLDRRGNHSHDNWGGTHNHPVNDPGHAHHGMDLDGTGRYPSPVICKIYGAENKLDALFNDSNHTHAVEALLWTMEAKTNISIGSYESGHAHFIAKDGEHTHEATVTDIKAHTHVMKETERGGDQPFDITPRYLTVYVYVRS